MDGAVGWRKMLSAIEIAHSGIGVVCSAIDSICAPITPRTLYCFSKIANRRLNCCNFSPRNQIQTRPVSVRFVPGTCVTVFDFALCQVGNSRCARTTWMSQVQQIPRRNLLLSTAISEHFVRGMRVFRCYNAISGTEDLYSTLLCATPSLLLTSPHNGTVLPVKRAVRARARYRREPHSTGRTYPTPPSAYTCPTRTPLLAYALPTPLPAYAFPTRTPLPAYAGPL
eukprot:374341-Rhodomonas_salina.1